MNRLTRRTIEIGLYDTVPHSSTLIHSAKLVRNTTLFAQYSFFTKLLSSKLFDWPSTRCSMKLVIIFIHERLLVLRITF